MEKYKLKGSEELEKILDDMCNDRETCEFLQIDYANLKGEDVQRIRDYIIEICEV